MGETPDKEELGGSRTQTRAGAMDNDAADEDDALAADPPLPLVPAGERLGAAAGGRTPTTRPTGARTTCCRSCRATPARPGRCAACSRRVFDRGSVFEIGAALRPLSGHVAGAARRPAGGRARLRPALLRRRADRRCLSDKLARFVDICDQFHLPIVNFVDQPGFVIGTEAERQGTIRRGARSLYASYQATVPWVSVIVRKVFGVAGAGHGNAAGLNLRYAWPSGDWGSLPIEGGIQAAYRRELEAADDPVALYAEIVERLNGCAPRSARRSASASRRSSTRATRGGCCATGPSARTSWCATSCERAEGARPPGPDPRSVHA